ncbi:DUF5990 family protein [Streptomyces sp. B-S-A8]|uniref:DUF5990 family protein n=1 Tax=Streptomyces solicavernae TaxID=3043614 RepID=A0ABT6RS65_9ACTN|nr:DUF5990 family protein [Streptomyces sp. B-S-A8]MDI3387290.1 DUF5990 family protein [Streptomyces sp. B-S-A8]
MLIHIEGSNLPGQEWGQCGQTPGVSGYRNIHIAVQRRDRPSELFGLHPGDALSAHWELEVTARSVDGQWDLRGPYVQGRPGARFIYLSWGTVDDHEVFTMFRRAKLWLDGIDHGVLTAAVDGGLLVGRLGLTDMRGGPLCAAVRPPLIEWSTS